MANDLDTFRKILGLLGSEHEGERASAALKATAILKGMGKTWADVTVAGDRPVYAGGAHVYSGRGPSYSENFWKEPVYRYQASDDGAYSAYEKPRPNASGADMAAKFRAEQQRGAEQAKPGWWPAEPSGDMQEDELREQLRFWLSRHGVRQVGLGSFTLHAMGLLADEPMWTEHDRTSAIRLLLKLWKTHRPVAA